MSDSSRPNNKIGASGKMYQVANFKGVLCHAVLAMVCASGLTACFTLSSLPVDGADPAIAAPEFPLPQRPEFYLRQSYSQQQIDENRDLTIAALQDDAGTLFVETDGTWIGINQYELLLLWRVSRFVGATYEQEYGLVNHKVYKVEYEVDPRSGFFASGKESAGGPEYSSELRGNPDGSLTSVRFVYKDGQRYVISVTEERFPAIGSSELATFLLNDRREWKIASTEKKEALPDGRIRETTTPYRFTAGSESPTVRYMVPISPEAFATLGPLVKQREAERNQEEAEDKQARSDARWATFGAIVQGVGQAASAVATEQNAELARSNDLDDTLARITREAARKRQAELANQQAQASTRAAQQQAGREAAARQLAAANAYRAQQMAQTSDPATLRRLRSDNEKALLAARQFGAEQQVRNLATQQGHAVARSAQADRGGDQQVPVSARGQVSLDTAAVRPPPASGSPSVQQPLPQGGSQSPPKKSPANAAPSSTAVEYQTAAMAWCYRKPTSGAFLCSGPLQMMIIVGEPDLGYALKLAGCEGGEGRVPAIGTSEKFNCGYMLGPNQRRVTDQSPYPE